MKNINDSPVVEVTQRVFKPGKYGGFSFLSFDKNNLSIAITTDGSYCCLNASELRKAAQQFNDLADFVDQVEKNLSDFIPWHVGSVKPSPKTPVTVKLASGRIKSALSALIDWTSNATDPVIFYKIRRRDNSIDHFLGVTVSSDGS